ncbi:ankyrin repeat domain-containing protein [Metapseudomonas otitidis]|uniref:ankyrin repeat domain-containing protein n=1 Tax=Metapseudomonas otitidis TaxID=319939 RepID=UPI0013F62E44
MNLSSGATARRIGIRGLGLALALLAGAPVALAFDIDMDGIKWSGMARKFVLDRPETATLEIKPFRLPGLAQVPARVVLSQHRGLFYLNAYQDLTYQQRVYKSPPIALFSPEELRACEPSDFPIRVSERWPASNTLDTGLSLTSLSFDCSAPSDWQLSQRYLLVDQRDPQNPLLAISHRRDMNRMDFTPLQPISEATAQQWLQALQKFPPWFRPFTSAKGTITLNAYVPAQSPDDTWKQFRALHQQLLKTKDKRPGIREVEDFFALHDFRSIATERREYPGLLNDIAFWASEAGQLHTARPWLEEVLRRDPGRMPAYLNLADLDWAIYEQRPEYAIHQGRAVEAYRVYCGLRLKRQMSIPPRVLERLGITTANPQACQGFWPLVAADGRSALLHALDAPHLAIARLLLEHGARTSGLYNGSTLAILAMQRDLRDNLDLSQDGRLKFLIEAGVRIDEPDSRGETPLMQMAGNTRGLQAFGWLLHYPQDLDVRSKDDGETALYRAFSANNFGAVRQLIAAGADLDLSYGRGTCHGQPIGKSLLTLVAEQTAADARSPTVSQQDTLALFTLLLEKGADPTVGQQCEKKGYALLLEAISRNKREDLLDVLQRFAAAPPVLQPPARD